MLFAETTTPLPSIFVLLIYDGVIVAGSSTETFSIFSSTSAICPARTKSSECAADVVLDGAVSDAGVSLGGGDGGVT